MGVDGFFLHENGGIEPSMENSIDFTSSRKSYAGLHEKALEFLKNKSEFLYFEIVCEDHWAISDLGNEINISNIKFSFYFFG